jgi:RNA polymerase sigma-70 factor (ECF subfamily)
VAEDDEVLVARMAAGDDDAIGEVFDRYAPFLLGVARRVTSNPGLAEDVVQEVLTSLWSAPDRFDPARGSLRAYLGVLAHRRAVDVVRTEVRRQAREDRTAAEDGSRVEAQRAAADDVEVAAVVRQAIERLPDDQRAAVELAFWHGRTYREVAVILAIPEGTAKSRLRLAQAKLAEWLAPIEGEPV